jgi:hypothetical protein
VDGGRCSGRVLELDPDRRCAWSGESWSDLGCPGRWSDAGAPWGGTRWTVARRRSGALWVDGCRTGERWVSGEHRRAEWHGGWPVARSPDGWSDVRFLAARCPGVSPAVSRVVSRLGVGYRRVPAGELRAAWKCPDGPPAEPRCPGGWSARRYVPDERLVAWWAVARPIPDEEPWWAGAEHRRHARDGARRRWSWWVDGIRFPGGSWDAATGGQRADERPDGGWWGFRDAWGARRPSCAVWDASGEHRCDVPDGQ